MIIINYWAVLAAAIVSFVFGAIWFMPLFGKTWMQYLQALAGVPDRGPAFSGNAAMGVKFLASLVLTYVLAILLALAHPATWINAASFGFMVAAGFVVTTQMNAVLFERKPLKIFAISAGFEVLSAMLAAVVLFYW